MLKVTIFLFIVYSVNFILIGGKYMIFNNINVSMINKDIITVQKYKFQNKNTL